MKTKKTYDHPLCECLGRSPWYYQAYKKHPLPWNVMTFQFHIPANLFSSHTHQTTIQSFSELHTMNTNTHCREIDTHPQLDPHFVTFSSLHLFLPDSQPVTPGNHQTVLCILKSSVLICNIITMNGTCRRVGNDEWNVG